MEKKLTAEQALLLLNPGKPDAKDIARLTLLSLLEKDVLRIESEEVDGETMSYVLAGDQLMNYQADQYELYFILLHRKDPSLRVLFATYVKSV